MKSTLLILSFLLPYSAMCQSAQVSKKDSVKLELAINAVFKNFATPSYETFEKITMPELRCLICDDVKGFARIKRTNFFNNHLKVLRTSDDWKKAAKGEKKVFIVENKEYSDVTAFITINEKHEISPGHEGAQLGLYFKRDKDEFKFAGIESIP